MQLLNEMFNTWGRMMSLSLVSTEIMLVSGDVLTKRSTLIGNNITTPGNIEDEVFLLSQEKIDVAIQSSTNWVDGSLLLGQKLLEVSSNNFLKSYQSVFFTPTLQNNFNKKQCQLTHLDQLIESQGRELLSVFDTALSVMEDSIKPMHECVVDNEKRLKN